jgi:FixJ family two-component response regulator
MQRHHLREIDMTPRDCQQGSQGLETPLIFLVDNDDSARRSLEPLLRTEGWRTEAFACAQEFLARPRAPGASCLVTEVALPDIDGLELQQRLAAGGPDMPIVFVTRCGDVATTVRAMKAGAVDFITKPFVGCELVAAVAEAIERSQAALRQQAQIRELRDHYESLTPRERDVMAGAVSGRLNKQIAADLDISEITVKAHRGKMMRKMYARSLAALVDIAGRLSSSGIHCRRYGAVAV